MPYQVLSAKQRPFRNQQLFDGVRELRQVYRVGKSVPRKLADIGDVRPVIVRSTTGKKNPTRDIRTTESDKTKAVLGGCLLILLIFILASFGSLYLYLLTK